MPRCSYKKTRHDNRGALRSCQFEDRPSAWTQEAIAKGTCVLHGGNQSDDDLRSAQAKLLREYFSSLRVELDGELHIDLSGLVFDGPLDITELSAHTISDGSLANQHKRSYLLFDCQIDGPVRAIPKNQTTAIRIVLSASQANAIVIDSEAPVSLYILNGTGIRQDCLIKSEKVVEIGLCESHVGGKVEIKQNNKHGSLTSVCVDDLDVNDSVVLENLAIAESRDLGSPINPARVGLSRLKARDLSLKNVDSSSSLNIIESGFSKGIRLERCGDANAPFSLDLISASLGSPKFKGSVNGLSLSGCTILELDLSASSIEGRLEVEDSVLLLPPRVTGTTCQQFHLGQRVTFSTEYVEVGNLAHLENKNLYDERVKRFYALNKLARENGTRHEVILTSATALDAERVRDSNPNKQDSKWNEQLERRTNWLFLTFYGYFSKYGRSVLLPIYFLICWTLIACSAFSVISMTDPKSMSHFLPQASSGPLPAVFETSVRATLNNMFQPLAVFERAEMHRTSLTVLAASLIQSVGNLYLFLLAAWSIRKRFES